MLFPQKPLLPFLIFLVYTTPSYAQSAPSPHSYNEAYQLCSPYAHNKTKTKCHYASTFENFYTGCMEERGFADDEGADPAYYQGYYEAYRYCSSYSDQQAKNSCDYGNIFYSYYNTCMTNFSYNKEGEKIPEVSANSTPPEGKKNFKFDF